MSPFETSTGYSPRNAYWLSEAAKLAYASDKKIQIETQEAWNFDNYQFLNGGDTQGFIIGNQRIIVIAFRGTEPSNLQDWMTDSRIHLQPAFGGAVHSGFLEGLNHVWDLLIQKLEIFQDQNQPILITGHSLGAALATLATARLREMGKSVNGLYTFGSPRVGNVVFATKFNQDFKKNAFRFVNDNDVVTRVVPRTFGYKHVGSLLYFDTNGILHQELEYWENFKKAVRGGFNLLTGDAVADHNMDKYQNNILFSIETPKVA
jgi:triacylglycerol lipase